MAASSARAGDKVDGTDSQHGGRGNMMNKKPSSMQVQNLDYGGANGGKLNLPAVGRKDSQSRLASVSRMRGASRTNLDANGGRDSPRGSSMNVREAMGG